ncbi:MAG TPA: hypothetical protein VLG50_08270 [Candidatus Saccharimonadales bacterium]|nr:hypothetical protein [Candidatus Saccharimonadales bacterium]
MDLEIELDQTTFSVKEQTFKVMCETVSNADDIMAITEYYHNHSMNDFINTIRFKFLYNKYIGLALPTKIACQIVVDFWKKHNGILIDLGAGTGLFCKVFNHLGIPNDKLVAVDLPDPPSWSRSSKSKNF